MIGHRAPASGAVTAIGAAVATGALAAAAVIEAPASPVPASPCTLARSAATSAVFRSESQSDMSESPFIRWKRPSQRGHNVVPDMERQWIRHSMGFFTWDPWTHEELADIAKGYPGAFCGHFLAMVFSRQGHGTEVTHTKLLREVSVTAWARRYISKVEPRDFQEVATLAFALDLVNANRVDSALDVIAQRILAVKRAQEDGGSWKTAEQMELVRSSSTGVLWFMVPPCGQGGVGLAGARG